jgi:hypothetical protein
MTNLQLYIAIGLPTLLVLGSLANSLFYVSAIRKDLRAMRADLRAIVADIGPVIGK